MATLLESQVTDFLTTKLGRAPTTAEIAQGIISPWTLANVHNALNVGQSILNAPTSDDIQPAIDAASEQGGGSVSLHSGTYNISSDINLPSNVNLVGSGSNNTVIDFGNGAYSLKAVGTNAYTTGTVSISFGSSTVTGSGTTFTSDMIGRSILLGDFWFTIEAFGDATTLTVDAPYGEDDLVDGRYAIAVTVTNIHIEGLTVQNSSQTLIDIQYVDGLNYTDVVAFNGLVGFSHQYVANLNSQIIIADTCGTGWIMNDTVFATFFNYNALNCTGNGMTANYFRNSAFEVFAVQNCGGIGMSFSNSSNVGSDNFSIQSCNIGIEWATNNFQNAFVDGVVVNCVTDGIKLTDSSDTLQFTSVNIQGNGGYGMNIANANCDNNIIIGNTFLNNTSGSVTDSGTGTLIRSNIGVADN